MGQQPKVDSRDEAMVVDDSCCGSGLAQGASADTAEMQAQVQALRSRGEYRNAGLSYAAARSLVAMKQQSMEAWLSRETAAGWARAVGACVEFGSMAAQHCWP